MALFDSGMSANEVARTLGYKSGNSVRVIIFHLRHANDARRRRIYLDLRPGVYSDLITISKEWKCSIAEVARTLIICGIEDIKEEEED